MFSFLIIQLKCGDKFNVPIIFMVIMKIPTVAWCIFYSFYAVYMSEYMIMYTNDRLILTNFFLVNVLNFPKPLEYANIANIFFSGLNHSLHLDKLKLNLRLQSYVHFPKSCEKKYDIIYLHSEEQEQKQGNQHVCYHINNPLAHCGRCICIPIRD